jgi:predicted RNA-binding Zn-ribbon protein involved in translation (DUF1610 family)
MDLASPRPPDCDHRRRGSGLSRTARDPVVRTAEVNFTCPHCGSFYEVVRAKASPEALDPRITCPTCDGPLPTREAQFVLKYFLLRKADRGWYRTPLGGQTWDHHCMRRGPFFS